MVNSAPLGIAETASYGVLMATILGGSTLLNLASDPWIYTEDIAWGTTLMLGRLVRPGGRARSPELETLVVLAGVFILATELTGGSAGVGCVVAAVAIAGVASDRPKQSRAPAVVVARAARRCGAIDR